MNQKNGRPSDFIQDKADPTRERGEIMKVGMDAMVSDLTHEEALDQLDKPITTGTR